MLHFDDSTFAKTYGTGYQRIKFENCQLDLFFTRNKIENKRKEKNREDSGTD